MIVAVLVRARLARRGNTLVDWYYLRTLTLTSSLVAVTIGLLGIINLARDPYESLHTAWVPYVVFSLLAIGGTLFATGAAIWSGRTAFVLRLVGWFLMAVPVALPSTLILGFPIIAILFVTLMKIEPQQKEAVAGTKSRASVA